MERVVGIPQLAGDDGSMVSRIEQLDDLPVQAFHVVGTGAKASVDFGAEKCGEE